MSKRKPNFLVVFADGSVTEQTPTTPPPEWWDVACTASVVAFEKAKGNRAASPSEPRAEPVAWGTLASDGTIDEVWPADQLDYAKSVVAETGQPLIPLYVSPSVGRAGEAVPCGEPFCGAVAMYCSRHSAPAPVTRKGSEAVADAEIQEWVERHDLRVSSATDARAAFEDARSLAAPQRGEVTPEMVEAIESAFVDGAVMSNGANWDEDERERNARKYARRIANRITAALSSQRERK